MAMRTVLMHFSLLQGFEKLQHTPGALVAVLRTTLVANQARRLLHGSPCCYLGLASSMVYGQPKGLGCP